MRARVLVVDDSVVVRRLVASILAEEEAIEVVGTAPNGRIALDKVDQLRPDIVVLDIEMPEMDGLTALARMREHYPQVKVIMFSVLTERGAGATLDALRLGAADYVTKPAGKVDAVGAVREQLVGKVLALCASPAAGTPPPPPCTSPLPAREPTLVAIAASTGGPEALAALLGALPAHFPLPVVVVQHMPALFTRMFAQRLDGRVALPVKEAASGDRLDGGGVWIAPGGQHLVVEHGRLRTHRGPPMHGCRPSADALFFSIARDQAAHAVAVVLSGMGRDGLEGARAIHALGGRVLAQDRATSVVWGMPRHVVEAGLASTVGAPPELAAALRALVLREATTT